MNGAQTRVGRKGGYMYAYWSPKRLQDQHQLGMRLFCELDQGTNTYP
jgi:hypothetical protein